MSAEFYIRVADFGDPVLNPITNPAHTTCKRTYYGPITSPVRPDTEADNEEGFVGSPSDLDG